MDNEDTMKPTPAAPTPFEDEVLTVEEVAALLKLTANTIYARTLKGEIPGAFRIGEGEQPPLRFSKRVVLEWIHKEASRP